MSQHIYLGFSYSDPFGTDLSLYPSFSDSFYGQKLQSSSVDETLWAEPSSLTENGWNSADTSLLCTEFHENYKNNILNVVLKLSQESHVIAIIQRFALYLENTKQTQGQHSIYYLCSFHGTTCKRGHIVCKTTWASLVWRSQSWNHVTTNV